MRHVSLCSGVGGLDVAADWAGFSTSCFVERDDFCQRVLRKNWPGVPIHDDIKTFDFGPYVGVPLVSAGFPCQPVSRSGKRMVEEDERWLWPFVLRLVRGIRPDFLLLENVTGLLDCGMGAVLGDLAAAGFDAEWQVLPASAFGAFHQRERVFVLAYAAGKYGDAHGLLEASDQWRASVESGGLHRLAVAAGGKRPHARLGCEPDVARMVRRVPGGAHRTRALGNCVDPRAAYPIMAAIANEIKDGMNGDHSGSNVKGGAILSGDSGEGR